MNIKIKVNTKGLYFLFLHLHSDYPLSLTHYLHINIHPSVFSSQSLTQTPSTANSSAGCCVTWKVMKRPGKLMPISVRKHSQSRKRTIKGKDSFFFLLLMSTIHQEPTGPLSEIRARRMGSEGQKDSELGKRGDRHQANKFNFPHLLPTFLYLFPFAAFPSFLPTKPTSYPPSLSPQLLS